MSETLTLKDIIGWKVEEIDYWEDSVLIDFYKGKDRIRVYFPINDMPGEPKIELVWNP